jgi:glycine/D-amino acid oxidase-like deaminating enzyme
MEPPSSKISHSLLEADPGLPVSEPTIPFWQTPLHPLAQVASKSLPKTADVVILGSGMTGCSVAKGLLEGDSDMNIVVLEARSLTSGASSRNGGHIVSPSVGDFGALVDNFGAKGAVEIAEFTLNNVDLTFKMVEEFTGSSLKADSEIRRTEKVSGFTDQETFDETRKALELWNKEMPSHRKDHLKLISAEEAKERYGLQNVVGAAIGPGAAVWPYRLWTGLWSLLYEKYRGRLAIETFTPAISVKAVEECEGKRRYLVETPRGEITTSKVVYCVNAFTSHLLPNLRGKLFPLRGTMSVQELGPSFANCGADRSWSFLSSSKQDPGLVTRNAGLYYLTQNPKSGYMFLGGEHDRLENILSSDDSKVNNTSAGKVAEFLPKVFDGIDQAPEIKSLWSGIMGFSRDGLPLIGRLPEVVSGRKEGEEWIAAGFSGYGTAYCFSCGQAVAQMILGKDVSSWVPSAFLITKERFQNSLVTSKFWIGLLG